MLPGRSAAAVSVIRTAAAASRRSRKQRKRDAKKSFDMVINNTQTHINTAGEELGLFTSGVAACKVDVEASFMSGFTKRLSSADAALLAAAEAARAEAWAALGEARLALLKAESAMEASAGGR